MASKVIPLKSRWHIVQLRTGLHLSLLFLWALCSLFSMCL